MSIPGPSWAVSGGAVVVVRRWVAVAFAAALVCASCSGPRYQRMPGDAAADLPGAGGTGGGVGGEGSGGSAGTGGMPTPGQPVGAACTGPGECQNGFCFDGVCCATDCSNPCQSCAAPGSVGTCVAAAADTDPRNECTDQGLASCGNDGMCDGAGACRRYAAGSICKAAACSGATLTPAHRCNGTGTCVAAASQPCDPFMCGADGTCGTACTTSAECVAPNICNAGSCGKKPLGGSCLAAADCNSGICAQGVCCQTACADNCKSCAIAGSAGTCITVPAGADPLGQCADQGMSSCATDGTCDGAGKCRVYAAGTTCAAPTCTGSRATLAGRCDGMGTCAPGTNQDCSPYVCGTAGQCRGSCTTNADCATGNVCNGGTCGKKPAGGTCAVGTECASGFCAQGVCCNAACGEACRSCALPGRVGVCSPVPAGEDPQDRCAEQAPVTCGTDGVCDGMGACRRHPAGTTCGAQACTGSTEMLSPRCDGAGACVPGDMQSCAPYMCGSGGMCGTTCTTSNECTTGNVCTAMSCGKKPPGATCTVAADCASGICAQGVCCRTDCTGTCRSCALAGTAGTCSTVPAGQDPLNQCADQGAMTCGTDGMCDGTGACRAYASGTECAAVACTGSTASAARVCNGTGTCQTAVTSSCGAYACDTNGQCRTTCTANTDCVAPNVCNSGMCSKKLPGTMCAAGTECASGLCQQGVCCLSACTGLCQSCALAGSAGTCTNVPAGQDPENACTDAGATGCGTDGTCNGGGACRLYASGTMCVAAACSGTTLTPARTCDGAGVCRTATTSQCTPYTCNSTMTGCRMTCTTSADCVAPNTCINGSCGKLTNGAPCTTGTECNSTFCVQNICCNVACGGACQACNLTGAVGTCTNVPAGQDPLNSCADQGATSCGTDGACNGSGACRLYAGGTVCRGSTGVCDAVESCNGTTAMCPADTGSSAPPAPGSLVATAGNAQISLTWAAATGATGYVVKRATTSGGPYTTVGSPATTSYVDMGLTNGTTYYYVVSATSQSGACASANSSQASATPSACAGAVYCANFESDAVGSAPGSWTRVGGSAGDWLVSMNSDGTNNTRVLGQTTQLSSTARFMFASGGSPAAPWSGATSVTADVKVTAAGGTGTPVGRVCLRYNDLSNYTCLSVLTSGAIQIQTAVGGTTANGPSWSASVGTGSWAHVKLSISAAGAATATLGSTVLGTYTPPNALSSGRVAVGTQSAEAIFDNVVVTQP